MITSSNTGRFGCCRILSIALTDGDIRRMDAGAMLDSTDSHGTGVDVREAANFGTQCSFLAVYKLSW